MLRFFTTNQLLLPERSVKFIYQMFNSADDILVPNTTGRRRVATHITEGEDMLNLVDQLWVDPSLEQQCRDLGLR